MYITASVNRPYSRAAFPAFQNEASRAAMVTGGGGRITEFRKESQILQALLCTNYDRHDMAVKLSCLSFASNKKASKALGLKNSEAKAHTMYVLSVWICN